MAKPMKELCSLHAALALAWATPVQAQPPAEPAAPGDSKAAADVSPPDPRPDASADIVVTAQRREQRLKDVPIAITALSGKSLDASGIKDTRTLGLVTPGLNFVSSGPFAQPTIRGIGTQHADPGSDANVAIYVDGVYQASQTGNIFELSDVERLEVLKGPQGTLFGRNATGGAIRVITATPDQDARGSASVSYGRFNEVRADGLVNLPLAPVLALNVSGLYRRYDGYTRNAFDGGTLGSKEAYAFRGKLKLDATPDLSFTLAGNLSHLRDNSSYASVPINNNNITVRQGVVYPGGFYSPSIGPFDPVATVDSRGVSLTAQLDVGPGAINSITAYQHVKTFLFVDNDASPLYLSNAAIPVRQNTFTQELNFVSALDGPFNFTAGLFYYHDRSRAGLLVTAPTTTVASINTRIVTEALSGYFEGDLKLTDSLQLTGGVRYSTEKKDANAGIFGNQVVDGNRRWNRVTPRVVLKYTLSPQANVYASWSRGFKSGSYNLTSLQSAPVSPEDIDAYEVGFKYAAGRTTLNLSGFYYDYKNIQLQTQTNVGGSLVTLLQNAASARSYGLDAEATFSLSDALQLRAGFAWTHARYTNFPNALLSIPIRSAAGTILGGNLQVTGDASGNRMIRSPDYTANLTGIYTTELADGRLQLSATGSYNDGWYYDIGNFAPQKSFFVLNLAASWRAPNNRYELFAYGDNLTSAKYSLYVRTTTLGTDQAPVRPWTAGGGVRVFF